MGDRSQIAIKQHGKGKVYLYAHWKGASVYTDLAEALGGIGRGRWDDPCYLARIIFCEMVKGRETEETGFGIDTVQHGDIEHPIPVVDCEKQKITWELNDRRYPNMSFQELIDNYDRETGTIKNLPDPYAEEDED